MVVLPCILAVSVLFAEAKASNWTTHEIFPAAEDATCPEGMNITCNSIIDKSGTILRYERGNVTDDRTVPGKDCPWKIRAPRGTTILFETSCYHHLHVENQTEYEVCFTQASASDPSSPPSSSCSIKGYTKNATAPINAFDLYVSYKNGKKYALGFTIKISFLGTPLPEIPTTVPSTTTKMTTTSDASRTRGNFVLLVLFMFGILHFA